MGLTSCNEPGVKGTGSGGMRGVIQ